MERRMNPRKPLRLAATVHYPDEGGARRIQTVTRNLCYEGVFVETLAFAHLQGSIVRVELDTPLHGPIGLDALVLRSRADGLGLMFAYYSTEVFEQLDALLEPEANKRRCAAGAARHLAGV
ncbi:MAG TPA: PilZ domain-containing protein [Gammaproteobacteria bacterium]|nr:PilZ domain-containing protein [Gammaproteobacteria bacterium]